MKEIKAIEEIRIDQYLASKEDLSREQIKRLINDGSIKVNNKMVKPSYVLKINDLISFKKQEDKSLDPINLNLNILYEDDDLIVIYKPKGLIVHPGVSTNEPTLVNHLIYHSNKLSKLAGEERPGIVHRLDKDTSGLLVVAKTDEAYLGLKKQFQDNTVKRLYHAICLNPFNVESATIDMPIKRHSTIKTKMAVDSFGRRAITNIEVINKNDLYSYVKCSLVTGRTHQIRVHLSHIGHPIIGDNVYGKNNDDFNSGQLLHAKKIGFIHPMTNKYLEFDTKLPDEFIEALKKLKLT